MKQYSRKTLSILLSAVLMVCFISCQKAEKKETVREGLAHIEQEIITEIPQVPRLCDTLKLTKHRIDVGDCELYCDEEGKGMPIVLLHGGPGATHHYFHPHFSKAKKFARIIYYDQRGCGISDYEPGEGYSVDQAADDLDNLRKGLDIEKWVVLGHSYGGLLAQYYATKYPESLAGLILVGSSLGMHVPLEKTRQYDFMTKEEMKRMGEIRKELAELFKEGKIPQEKFMEVLVFNNHINGDWKRQNYYRPTREDHARMALYEWKQDPRFRGPMGQSIGMIDLKGAFEECPIPTMIMEGAWDLTWNTDKPGVLHENHPGSKLVMFEESSHNPFQDEPKKFFAELKDFIRNLSEIPGSEIEEWKAYLVSWKQEMETKPDYLLRTSGYGKKDNDKISELYSDQWLEEVSDPGFLLKLGFALYDGQKYDDALKVFQKMQEKSGNNNYYVGIAMIWQGHMLDLLGRRPEAVAVYQKVADMNLNYQAQHDQFGLKIQISPWAAERIKTPFKRIENTQE